MHDLTMLGPATHTEELCTHPHESTLNSATEDHSATNRHDVGCRTVTQAKTRVCLQRCAPADVGEAKEAPARGNVSRQRLGFAPKVFVHTSPESVGAASRTGSDKNLECAKSPY
mmetsp:Transcript_6474/g.18096  ORF Transcript_6474/g.18096 Transcript_6474/m.18096 type:complete len:114 (-) Transcript_6474:1134-1475(-)